MNREDQIRKTAIKVGRAIAYDVMCEDMPREWTGLDPQDGDQFSDYNMAPDEWDYAEKIARQAYGAAIEIHTRTGSRPSCEDITQKVANVPRSAE